MVVGNKLVVGMVDSVVAGVTEGGFICNTEERSFVFAADIALDLHLILGFLCVCNLQDVQESKDGKAEDYRIKEDRRRRRRMVQR